MAEMTGRQAALLASGGVESAVLCVEMQARFERVHPVYVRFGLRWEETELAWLKRFLSALARPGLEPLTVLDEPVAAIYGPHWSTGGRPVPPAGTPDEEVYLPGRNLLLLSRAAVWARVQGIGTLALGSLACNPFPDGRPEFDRAMEQALTLGLDAPFAVERPYIALAKPDILKRAAAAGLPLEMTFSCISPVGGLHCGVCSKCGERRQGFADAGVPDPTQYAASRVLRAG